MGAAPDEARARGGLQYPRESWRLRLKVGDLVDAMDSEKKWFDAVVKDVQPPKTPGGKDLIKVHYRGWTSKWDATFERDDAKVQPLFRFSENWRALRIGDSVEIRDASDPNKPLWYEGEVTMVGTSGEQVYVKTTNNSTVGSRWVSPQSEQVCAPGTHIKLPYAWRSGPFWGLDKSRVTGQKKKRQMKQGQG